MFTIKYRDAAAQLEMLYGDITNTSFNAGILTAHKADGSAVQFGPNHNPLSTPQAFVMNAQGATVGVYEFFYMPGEDDTMEVKLTLEEVEALAGAPKPNRRARRAAGKK